MNRTKDEMTGIDRILLKFLKLIIKAIHCTYNQPNNEH
jgi:hypothetical protein